MSQLRRRLTSRPVLSENTSNVSRRLSAPDEMSAKDRGTNEILCLAVTRKYIEAMLKEHRGLIITSEYRSNIAVEM